MCISSKINKDQTHVLRNAKYRVSQKKPKLQPNRFPFAWQNFALLVFLSVKPSGSILKQKHRQKIMLCSHEDL